ncbi:bifunctional glutamate N-acetyltransferase/amino-acid acetyltransferase ArgJ [bacterium]|nr:MAG: bifunctional glutamate N-acetyltransferase/amino-acid acetyltransferase ArgJ [bacterium]
MKIYKKAILPLGFSASGVSAGIKKSGKLDLALFYSSLMAKASCKFTANTMQAAPLKICKQYLKSNKDFQAIIINSGNANCFTGEAGLSDARKTTNFLAKHLGLKNKSVLVASTGIIGRRLPFFKIKAAIPGLVKQLSLKGIDQAKSAILTTDKLVKEISVKLMFGKKPVTICGIAKGAGMIAPNMATMLGFILTDAHIAQKALDRALGVAVGHSFNCITVDGCMSTNDSVMILANSAAGNHLIERGKGLDLFMQALNLVCLELAKMVIQDAEGATKFIQIKVTAAENENEAKKVALAIANSSLFKTAMYGENPNFGRIVASIGSSGVKIKERDLKIKVSSLKFRDIKVNVSINRGRSAVTVYTSDLSPEYIKINAEYN